MNIIIQELFREILSFTPLYHETKKVLESPFSPSLLEKKVLSAIQHVPYYRKNEYYRLVNNGGFSLTCFPVINKDSVIGREIEFVSDNFFKSLLRTEKTGGSTGKTMKLYYSPTLSITHDVFPNMIIEKYAGKRCQLALLRGKRPRDGKLWEVIGLHRILLSSYHLNVNNVDDYINILNKKEVACLLAFPSSLMVFAKLIKEKYGKIKLPYLKAIIASSEVFSVEEKSYVMEVFDGVTLIDYYSMNEFAAAAYSVNLGHYDFNFNYGYVEFVDTCHTTPQGNRISKIVATSNLNSTMPLIRYDTGDLAELDANGRVLSIIGRTAHLAVNKDNAIVPCIVVFSKEPMMRVMQYQYYQDTPGLIEVHVLPKDVFSEADSQVLLNDMIGCFGDTMDCRVKIVKEVEYTPSGKLQRMIQKLDLSSF